MCDIYDNEVLYVNCMCINSITELIPKDVPDRPYICSRIESNITAIESGILQYITSRELENKISLSKERINKLQVMCLDKKL